MRFYYTLNNDLKNMRFLGNINAFPEAFQSAHEVQKQYAAQLLSLYIPESHLGIFQENKNSKEGSRYRLIQTFELPAPQPDYIRPFVSREKKAATSGNPQTLRKAS